MLEVRATFHLLLRCICALQAEAYVLLLFYVYPAVLLYSCRAVQVGHSRERGGVPGHVSALRVHEVPPRAGFAG